MQDGDNESERALVRGGAVLYPREGGQDIEETLFFRVFVVTRSLHMKESSWCGDVDHTWRD